MYELVYIEKAVEKATKELEAKNLNPEQLSKLRGQLEFSPSEYAIFQETKSQFQAMGVLSLESAMWIYQKLAHYGLCSIAEKYVLTCLFVSMLKQKSNL